VSAQRIRWSEASAAGLARGPLTVAGGTVRVVADEDAPAGAVLLRRARAADVSALYELLERYAAQGLLLPRTREQVAATIEQFTVAVDAHGVAGCGALRPYGPELAEVCALAVAERLQGQSVGRCIVESIVEEAEATGVKRLFALTLREGFFNRLGFRTGRITELPEKVTADCAGCPKRSACDEIMVVRELGCAPGTH